MRRKTLPVTTGEPERSMIDTAVFPITAARGFVEALGSAVVLLDEFGVAQALSPAMRALIPGLEIGKLLALVLRDPDLIEAIEAVARDGERKTLELVERVPVERTFRIHIAALSGRGERRPTLLTFEDLSEQRVIERMSCQIASSASICDASTTLPSSASICAHMSRASSASRAMV